MYYQPQKRIKVENRLATTIGVLLVVLFVLFIVTITTWSTKARCARLMETALTHADTLIVNTTVLDRSFVCGEVLR